MMSSYNSREKGLAAIEQIEALYDQIKMGDDVEGSLRELASIAQSATFHFWQGGFRHHEALLSIARGKDSLPVNVSPINPPWDNRPKDKRLMPYEVELALQLPIGESLPLKVKGKGQRRVQHDWLYCMLQGVIRYDFGNLRFIGEANDEIEERILALPELKKDTLKNWLDVIVEFLIQRKNCGKPLDNEESRLYQIAIGRATTLLDQEKRKKIKSLCGDEDLTKLRSREAADLSMEEASLLTEAVLVEARHVGINHLRRALREDISTRLKSTLNG